MEWINQREIFKKSLKLLLFHSEEKEGERETEIMEVKARKQNKGLTDVAPTTEYGHLALQHICCQLIRTPPLPQVFRNTPSEFLFDHFGSPSHQCFH